MKKLYILDLHPCFILGMRNAVDLAEDISICGVSYNISTGVAEAINLQADIILIDTSIPGYNEAEIRAKVDKKAHLTKLLALTHPSQEPFPQQGCHYYMNGYISKTATAAEIINALSKVLNGDNYNDVATCSNNIVMKPNHGGIHNDAVSIVDVSRQEAAVLKLSAFGYSCKEIARDLNLSPKSVETYKARALHKLGLESRVDVVRFASLSGWYGAIQ